MITFVTVGFNYNLFTMINSVTFAKRLKQLMDYYGLSASAFSDEIDFNRSTISHLLSGRNKPSLDFVMKVLNRFPEVTISWFLYGKGNFPSNQGSEFTHETTNFESKAVTSDRRSIPNKNEDSSPASELQDDLIVTDENKSNSKKHIKRIVIFYSDSSFETYEN